ncbi:DNA polymerase III subunit chi [Croceibacterium atlanticum]|uniref:DNA polymerase III subunit chi n=1 Tax=Croceibacterium atlanticum TaxID=1267766 RepID=A0A0F7KNT2_9SPHN|nr:DNA polymerase III subunit chi [Croceibacterium atlanticum]
MRVDFYQLAGESAENLLPLLARKVRADGERLLIVSEDAEQLQRIGRNLWERFPEAFLAHGHSGARHAERQPILLSADCEAPNAAPHVVFADGRWRDGASNFARVFLLFGEEQLQGARDCWRMLGQHADAERHFWKQEGGRWREGP